MYIHRVEVIITRYAFDFYPIYSSAQCGGETSGRTKRQGEKHDQGRNILGTKQLAKEMGSRRKNKLGSDRHLPRELDREGSFQPCSIILLKNDVLHLLEALSRNASLPP